MRKREHPLYRERLEIDPVAFDVVREIESMEQDEELRTFAAQFWRAIGALSWTAFSVWIGWVLGVAW